MKLYTDKARKGYTDVDKNKTLDNIRRSIQSKIFFEYVESKDSKILDIGCGGGGFLKILSSNGYIDIYGIEPDPKLLEGVLDECPEFEGRVLCSGATLLPFEDDFFDCVYFFNVMHHLEDVGEYRKAIDESCRVLKETGLLIMIEPCNAFIYYVKRNVAFVLSHFSKFWANMYDMMSDEKELMEKYISEEHVLYGYIKGKKFKFVKNTKFIHQSILIAQKKEGITKGE